MPPRSRPTAFDVTFGKDATRPGQSISLRESGTRPESARDSPFSGPTWSGSSRPGKHPQPPHNSVRTNTTPKVETGISRPLSSASKVSSSRSPTVVSPSLVSRPSTPASVIEKRKSQNAGPSSAFQPGKRRRLDELAKNSYIQETESTTILGEDPTEEYENGDKPIRLLTDFCIFDSCCNEELTLDDLSASADNIYVGVVQAIGDVAPIYEEEDAGQDDDYLETINNIPTEPQRLRTSKILDYSINYAEADSPIYLRTSHAWYMLGMPSARYKEKYLESYKPHRMAQLIISRACDYPKETYERFKEHFLGSYDYALHVRIKEKDLLDSASVLLGALEDPALGKVSESPLIREFLSAAGRQVRVIPRQIPSSGRRLPAVRTRSYVGNIDLRVLRPENQNRTYVTPLIDYLSRGLFRERLRVAGYSGPFIQKSTKKEKNLIYRRLLQCLKLAKATKSVFFASADRLCGEYWKAVTIANTRYSVGDIVVVTAGQYPGRETLIVPDVVDRTSVPSTHTLADYFWFAKIIWINQQRKTAHVHWMEHASKTYLQEMHDPQELFMVEMCDDTELQLIVGKVDVQDWSNVVVSEEFRRARAQLRPSNFFYRQAYDQVVGAFSKVDQGLGRSLFERPPDNCSLCLKIQEREEQKYGRQLKSNGKTVGIAYRSIHYHINDFAIIKSDSSMCTVGQIVDIRFRSQSCILRVSVLGRMCDIRHVCPEELKDERHFFLTDLHMDVPLEDILGPCKVMNANELPVAKLDEWLAMSPRNLFIRYHFPSLDINDISERTIVKGRYARMLEICKVCYDEEQEREELRRQYRSGHPDSWQLRTFDPFGGVGAFALAMQQAGCLKLTHAVEISPSAAKTLQSNSPDTIVYNQCANEMLEYAVKYDKHQRNPHSLPPEAPKIIDKTQHVPKPPRPRDVDCITAGFPCQPHSRLNMFQKANDRKSNLILNLLSWVDFLKPKYCVFENVRGFLKFNLNSVQVDKYRVQGGIEMGGLKFVVRAMIAMGYQVRFGLLQAAHYGTPQSRVRFFLIAARLDLVLPELPQALYDFALKDSLEIKFPHGLVVRPFELRPAVGLFGSITVDDAISDLPRFDWTDPYRQTDRQRRDPQTQDMIPIERCDKMKPYCGPLQAPYHHAPRTLFQKTARQPRPGFGEAREAGQDIQHFTRVLKDDVIARVVNIPLRAKADYRALFTHEFRYLWEWQMSDPKSATARRGYRPGMYGRLDKDSWFQTTVTNVEPTAKQSWVLNPYCKRVVTVRELARSQGFPDQFRFYCVTNDIVKTMHREIGNAVPWPVGLALGREVDAAMFEHWLEHRGNQATVIS